MTAAGLDAPEVVKFGIRDGDEGKYFLRTRTVSLLTEVEREKVKGSLESALGKPKSWDASAEMGNVIRVQYDTEQTHQSLKDAAVKAGLFDAAIFAWNRLQRGATPISESTCQGSKPR